MVGLTCSISRNARLYTTYTVLFIRSDVESSIEMIFVNLFKIQIHESLTLSVTGGV